jgi:hypothetical protein
VQSDDALFDILNLQTGKARLLLNSANGTEEFNMYNEFLHNWADVIELTLIEDEEIYDLYLTSLNQRLNRIDEHADKNDASYHILLAEIYTHAAMAHIVYSDFFSGFRKLLKANKHVKSNEELHPGFWRNNKMGGAFNVSFDMMAPVLQTIASIFGLRGDESLGYKQLNQYLADVENYPGLKSEAFLYYGFVLKMAKRAEEGCKLLSQHVDKQNAPALSIFLISNLLYTAGRNEEALSYLEYFPKNSIELPFHHYEYMMGKEKLNRLDADAGDYLKLYLDSSAFKNYQREVCLKLSHHHFIHGNMAGYKLYQDKIDDYPKAKTDRDREADVEHNRPYPPHKELLKVRYLVSGGYNSTALEILDKINLQSLEIPGYINEYYLLQGRVKSSQSKTMDALSLFNLVLEQGSDEEEHFAAEAALLAGKIHLKEDNIQLAIKYFETAKNTDCGNDVYIEIIHKKAKNLLKEIETDSRGSDKSKKQ